MKRLYKKFVRWLHNFGYSFERKVIFLLEWYAILRKRKLYKHIKWTKEQKREFDNYWKKHYGKKISPRWHKLYEASNGVFRVDYFPEVLYSTILEPKINNLAYCNVLSDKNMLDVLFNKKYEGIRTPKTFIYNSHNQFFDGDRKVISKEKAKEIIYNVGYAVIKPTVDSSSGRNVIIANFKNGIDTKKNLSIDEIFDIYGSNFIVQEKIEPHVSLSTIYPNSINTFRVISYIVDDRIEIAPISLRIGGGGSEVDNIHAGGMSIAINKDGTMNAKAYRLGYGSSFENYERHPDTGIEFKKYKFDYIDQLVDAATKLHAELVNVGMISWDFTMDGNKNIVVIEVNLKGQSAWFPQMLSGEPLFGENTKNILASIKK